MTNWMTATGVALIAGGIATLLGYRRTLANRGGRPDEPLPAVSGAGTADSVVIGPAAGGAALPTPVQPAVRPMRPAAPATRPAAAAAENPDQAVEPVERATDRPEAAEQAGPEADEAGPEAGPAESVAGPAESVAGPAESVAGPAEPVTGPAEPAAVKTGPAVPTGDGDGDRDRDRDRDEIVAATPVPVPDEDFGDPDQPEDGDMDHPNHEAPVQDASAGPEDLTGETPQRRMARAVLARSYDTHPELVAAAVELAEAAAELAAAVVGPAAAAIGKAAAPVEPARALRAHPEHSRPVPVEPLPTAPPAASSAIESAPTQVMPAWPPLRPDTALTRPRAVAPINRTPPNRAENPWVAADVDGRDGWQRAVGRGDRPDPAEADRQRPRHRLPARRNRSDNALQVSRMLDGRRRVSATTEFIPVIGDPSPMMPSIDVYAPVDVQPRSRTRPRPRAMPEIASRTTVYRSRHSAEPG